MEKLDHIILFELISSYVKSPKLVHLKLIYNFEFRYVVLELINSKSQYV